MICGPPDRVAEAMTVLGRRNLLGQVLDFRSGFHTSALLPALPLLRDHIDRFPLRGRHADLVGHHLRPCPTTWRPPAR